MLWVDVTKHHTFSINLKEISVYDFYMYQGLKKQFFLTTEISEMSVVKTSIVFSIKLLSEKVDDQRKVNFESITSNVNLEFLTTENMLDCRLFWALTYSKIVYKYYQII